MCARRELFHKVGGFNHRLGRSRSKLPLGCEETELCIRAQRAMPDGRIIYEPAAFAYHKVTAKRLTLGYFVLRCYAEGVSKAYLTTRVRTKGALALEARYVLRTLAPAFGRGFTELALRADVNALKRSFAIALGLASTCAGYLTGKFRIERTMSPRPQTRAADAVARQ
jgi:GT2 family glycosyltransferase